MTPHDAEFGVYVISVAAELTGLHAQTLRTYDRIGLVSPGRSGGGGRRYSTRDIELLRTVAQLTAEGIGLEGVRRIMALENQVDALRARVRELEDQLGLPHPAVPNLPARRAGSTSVVVWRR